MEELSREEQFCLLRQGDAAQITGDHSQAQPPLHPVLPVIDAFAPAEIPSQTGNAALDARAPAIAPAPGARALQCLSFLRELACGRDGHAPDPSCLQALLRFRRLDAPVAGHQARRMLKDLLVVGDRLQRLSMLGGVLQDLVARHDAALHLVEDDVAAKLDQRADFMPGNGAGVWLEEAEYLLAGCHLLALQHTRARLGDHTLDHLHPLFTLAEQTLGLWPRLLPQR